MNRRELFSFQLLGSLGFFGDSSGEGYQARTLSLVNSSHYKSKSNNCTPNFSQSVQQPSTSEKETNDSKEERER